MRKKTRQNSALGNKLLLLLSSLFFSVATFSQSVSGTVTDGNKPIGSVTVQVKGSSRATSTDVAGKFTINASPKDVLLFSSVGYLRQEVPINGRESLSVVLVGDSTNLSEVTVTALGITKI